jgi:hypothetical protein
LSNILILVEVHLGDDEHGAFAVGMQEGIGGDTEVTNLVGTHQGSSLGHYIEA